MVKLKISLLIILSIFLLLTVYVAIGASLIIKPAKAFSANLKASAAANVSAAVAHSQSGDGDDP